MDSQKHKVFETQFFAFIPLFRILISLLKPHIHFFHQQIAPMKPCFFRSYEITLMNSSLCREKIIHFKNRSIEIVYFSEFIESFRLLL